MNSLIKIEDLRTWFPIKKGLLKRTVGHIKAVDGVSFEVEQGETLALVGESGCGKTTTGRSLLRLEDPTGGKVFYQGRDITNIPKEEMRELRRDLQIVFQDPAGSLNPRMRIRDIIAEGMESFNIGASYEERTELVKGLLGKVQLDPDALWRYPHEFSGGQRQRVVIARALAVNPKFVVCDESVSALDVSIQAQVLNLLKDLQKELDLTYLFITHDLSVVRYLADRVAVMYAGKIVEQGKTAELFADPKHPYTKALLGAIPSLDVEVTPHGEDLPGEIPSASNPPPGCRFQSRCPLVSDECRTGEFPLLSCENGHLVACPKVVK